MIYFKKLFGFIKNCFYFLLKLFLIGVKVVVYIESFILNHFTNTKGDGLILRLWLYGNNVKVGKYFYTYYPFYLFCRGNLEIGSYCSFGEFTKIWNFDKITIGDDFIAAEGLTILTGSHDPDTLIPIMKNVIIGNRVWCGANVTILPGVTIGNDVVIGAGTLVLNDVPNGSIVAGNPGKIIKEINTGKREIYFYSRRNLINKKIS